MNAINDNFEAICLQEFSFLANYGFALSECRKDNYGCCLTYKNTTAALKIQFARGEILIDVYKLHNGQIPTYPVFFDQNKEFLVFDVNDLIIIRTGTKVEQNAKLMYTQEYMKKKIKEFATLLIEHAGDVLSGDFAILHKIKERVVSRAKELKHEQ